MPQGNDIALTVVRVCYQAGQYMDRVYMLTMAMTGLAISCKLG